MDPAVLATAAIQVMLPWLTQVGVKALDKLQGDAVDGAAGAPAKLFGWMKEKLAPHPIAAATLAALPAAPADETNQRMLALQLEKLLKENAGLREELAKLIPPEALAAAGQTLNVSGSGHKVAQLSGSNSTITIS